MEIFGSTFLIGQEEEAEDEVVAKALSISVLGLLEPCVQLVFPWLALLVLRSAHSV